MEIEVFVEIPRGSRNKYEFDDRRGLIRLDRVLFSSVHYPTDYGFIPNTLAPDGDHLDALVVCEEPTFPGCLVPARAIGVLCMTDEKGQDDKILAVPCGDPRFDHIRDLADLPRHWLAEIANFFTTYKMLEDKATTICDWSGVDRARAIVEECLAAAQQVIEE
ncbi:MAG: inorganic diphosphatase [Chloroflexota bacterium]